MKTFLLALAAPLALAFGLAQAAPKAAPLPSDSIYQLNVPLVDQQGRKLRLADKRGKVQLVSMFYTSCKFICPLIIDSGKAIERSLTPAEQQKLGLLMISMDPQRDNPAKLAGMMTKRKLDPTRWTLASPTPGDVRAIAGVLDIRYRQLEDGEFNHTSVWVLLDANGRILARTEQIGSRPDPEFVAAVRKAIAGSAAKPKR